MGETNSAGTLVLVVGPSGAGKDTLIAFARGQLAADPRFLFVRRVVTRPSDGESEDHDTLTPAEFEAAERAGEFPLFWRAHGLAYGLPRASLEEVALGRIVVANASRSVIGPARAYAPRLRVVHVTASPEVLARRLAMRGREDGKAIAGRLLREAPAPGGNDVVEIHNDRAVEAAGGRMVEILRSCAESGW